MDVSVVIRSFNELQEEEEMDILCRLRRSNLTISRNTFSLLICAHAISESESEIFHPTHPRQTCRSQ